MFLNRFCSLSFRNTNFIKTTLFTRNTVSFHSSVPFPFPLKKRKPLEIIFIRHGETEYNKEGKIQGQGTDVLLNKTGVKQALNSGFYLKETNYNVDRIYSSSLLRAKQTAAFITNLFEKDTIYIDEKLNEKKSGIFEKTTKEFREKYVQLTCQEDLKLESRQYETSQLSSLKELIEVDRKIVEYTKKESLEQLIARSKEFINEILFTTDVSKIIVVTHGIFLLNTLRWMFNKITIEREEEMIGFGNCSLIKLQILSNVTNSTLEISKKRNLSNKHLVSDFSKIRYSRTRLNLMFYASYLYPSSHWALQSDPDYLVAEIKYGKFEYSIKINPTDCRGYRLIISLTNKESPHLVFNRKHTEEEREGLLLLSNKIISILQTTNMIVQLEMAGNNAYETLDDGETFPVTFIGKKEEPSILHLHLICRGIQGFCYIHDVPLYGPLPGEIFNMRGPKIGWKKDELKRYRTWLQMVMEKNNLIVITSSKKEKVESNNNNNNNNNNIPCFYYCPEDEVFPGMDFNFMEEQGEED